MKNNTTLSLSICIPCFGRVEYVRKTLKSIFQDNSDVALDKYEVIISDNDPKQAVKVLMEEFGGYSNLKYFKTECEGFMNSYYVLTYARGALLKLHNSQSLFKMGTLREMINDAERYMKDHTLVFYTNGLLENFKSLKYDSFDSFMYALSYWSSWSNGFCVWRKEFEKIETINLNKLFPHTSLFLTQYYASSFCINDQILFEVQRIPKRGGHNKFEAFTIEYPSLIDQCWQNGLISEKCKKHVFKDLMIKFLPSLIFNKHIIRIETFDDTGFRSNLKKYFPKYAYWLVFMLAVLQPIRLFGRYFKRYIWSYQKAV